MNRSFRAPEAAPQPGAAMTTRGKTLGAVMKDKDEDLTLFLEMRKREKERNDLLHNSDELDLPLGSKPRCTPIFRIVASAPARRAGVGGFLDSESDKDDYDWLLTPPGTPLFSSLDKESNRSRGGNVGTPKAHPTVLKSRLANPSNTSSRSSLLSRRATSSTGLNSSAVGTKRPSSSGAPIHTSSRPATPTGRPTLTTSKSSRPSTLTSRATLCSKSAAPLPRSSAPASRSSTPTSRPSSIVPSRPASRSATPTRQPPTLSSIPISFAPPGRSSSVTKSGTTALKSSVPSRGSSPTVKSRPWKPSDMPGFSLDAPPNLRTSLPDRPSSASQGRPGTPSSRSSFVEAGHSVRPRQQSCSPSRGRPPNGNVHSGNSVTAVSRSHVNGRDGLNPVLIGNKVVERVVNMRRLAAPKKDDQRSTHNSLPGKPSLSLDGTGFGRTLSEKSLDMALRHMDIRRSIRNSLRPLMTRVPASSMYSVRSGPMTSRPIRVSDSPLATSSNASSEQSVNNNMIRLDGSELEDDLSSEKGGRSFPASAGALLIR